MKRRKEKKNKDGVKNREKQQKNLYWTPFTPIIYCTSNTNNHKTIKRNK